jgi:hypothetical protein
MSRLGAGSYLAIGEESTYGTAVTRTHWLRSAREMSLAREVVREVVLPLGLPGENAHNAEELYIAADNAGGSLTVMLGWEDGTPLLLRQMFGAGTTTGSGPYVHTFRFHAHPTTAPSLTMEQVGGAFGPASRAEVFEGCVFPSWEITAEPGQPLMVTLDVIAETSGGNASPSLPSFPAGGGWFYHNHLATATFDGDSLGSIKRMSIRGNRQLTRQPELGSLQTSRPLADGLMEIEVEIVHRFDNNDAYSDYLSGTVGALVLSFNNGGGKILGFTAAAAQITNCAKPINSAGPIDVTTTFKCLATSTNEGIICALTNALATIATASP